MKREYFILTFIILLAALLRFFKLGIVPSGITNDEMGYIYNSYSIAKTGRNVFGEFLPFFTWINIGGFPFLPVPTYLPVPLYWLFGLSATVGRFIPALFGVLDVLLLYILVRQIFKKTTLALISALMLAISPWHLHFSRSAYDPNYGLFFYLLGILSFIFEIKNRRVPIFSILAFLLAVFSYRGMNIIFPPLVLALIWYGVSALKMNRKQVTGFLIGTGLVLVSLTLVIILHGRTYLIAEGSIFNISKMQEEIDTKIREAQGPLSVRRLFLNKPTYIINKLRENYVKGYSPEFLFLYTEPNQIYSIWSRGRIHFFDLFLIILGIAYIFMNNKIGSIFISVLFLIWGLPGMIGGLPYSARNLSLSVLFPILTAAGALFVVGYMITRKLRGVVVVGLVVIYSYLLGSYLFDYYGRYAFQGAEAWFKSMRDVSLTVLENKTRYNKVIVGTSSFGDLLQYAFYAKLDPSKVQKAWQLKRRDGGSEVFSVENVSFTTECVDDGKENFPSLQGNSVLLIVHHDCQKSATVSAVIKDYFGNPVWKLHRFK